MSLDSLVELRCRRCAVDGVCSWWCHAGGSPSSSTCPWLLSVGCSLDLSSSSGSVMPLQAYLKTSTRLPALAVRKAGCPRPPGTVSQPPALIAHVLGSPHHSPSSSTGNGCPVLQLTFPLTFKNCPVGKGKDQGLLLCMVLDSFSVLFSFKAF